MTYKKNGIYKRLKEITDSTPQIFCVKHPLYIKYAEDQVNIILIKTRQVSPILKILPGILEFLTHIHQV